MFHFECNGEITKLPLEATIQVIPIEEHVPIKGNVGMGLEPKAARAVENSVTRRAENNIWAWCCVEVRASIGAFKGSAYMGCCSFKDADDFIKNSGYYPQMREEALAKLREVLEAAIPSLKKAEANIERLES